MFKTRTRIVLFWNAVAAAVFLAAPYDLKLGLASFVGIVMLLHLYATSRGKADQ